MTDKDGQIVASYEYDAWGNVGVCVVMEQKRQ
nr:hypothetical protein [Bacillus thuringiensis]